ncbi:hypothetical protein GGR56DRAFT_240236 [Xylariaceae sp. FL0804]|nr:hypothetical protein GGR56DRAFT_240236 [Xylariaceae sp. FL0804]
MILHARGGRGSPACIIACHSCSVMVPQVLCASQTAVLSISSRIIRGLRTRLLGVPRPHRRSSRCQHGAATTRSALEGFPDAPSCRSRQAAAALCERAASLVILVDLHRGSAVLHLLQGPTAGSRARQQAQPRALCAPAPAPPAAKKAACSWTCTWTAWDSAG